MASLFQPVSLPHFVINVEALATRRGVELVGVYALKSNLLA